MLGAVWTVAAAVAGLTGPTVHAGGPGCDDARTAVQAADPGTPVCTIVRGAELLADGGQIVVHPGRQPPVQFTGLAPRQTLTIRAEGPVELPSVTLQACKRLTVQGFRVRGRFDLLESGEDLAVLGNELGPARSGLYAYGWDQPGFVIRRLLVEGNWIHDVDYDGEQQAGEGYGIAMVGRVADVTIRDNVVARVAEDYVQGGGRRITVAGNAFLGPSLKGAHPQAHADLWQVFGTSTDLTFARNLAHRTQTHEGLLFQYASGGPPSRRTTIEGNVFDRGSDGYEMQIYDTAGLRLVRNTAVGSRWGVLLRHDPEVGGGRDYEVAGNVLQATDGPAFSAERDWGGESGNVEATGTGGALAPRADAGAIGPTTPRVTGLEAGDPDGDGVADVAVRTSAPAQVTVLVERLERRGCTGPGACRVSEGRVTLPAGPAGTTTRVRVGPGRHMVTALARSGAGQLPMPAWRVFATGR
jgi:hypothetical protein